MNRKKQIESTPALTALIAIARKNARTEGEVIAAVMRVRSRNPDLAEQADREVAWLDI